MSTAISALFTKLRYRDGTPPQIGDVVRGTADVKNVNGEIAMVVGVVVELVHQADRRTPWNCKVAYMQISYTPIRTRTAYARCEDFELLHRPDGADAYLV